MVDRLDEEHFEILRKWGAGLATDTRAELRAAGKAIMILIEEIDRLHDAQRMRGASKPPLIEASDRDAETESVEAVSSQSLGASLQERLGAVIPRLATDRDE